MDLSNMGCNAYIIMHVCMTAKFYNVLAHQLNVAHVIMQNAPGGESHMKQTGMLVISLRGVNFGFWSCIGCSRQSANILCYQGLV